MGNSSSSLAANQADSARLPEGHPSTASTSSRTPPPGCPMHDKLAQQQQQQVDTNASDVLNPLNNIPALAQAPLSEAQKTFLSLERTTSSIPRARSDLRSSAAPAAATPAGACPVVHSTTTSDSKGKGKEAAAAAQATDAGADDDEKWVYPSPQQFYNALMRKGKDTPEESIDSMVQIHNWLNEKAWDEIRRWEDRRNPNDRIELARFEGRPQDLSPKARYHLFLGSLFPKSYNSTPPFDRHDWHIRRNADGTFQRYVIDYYSCPDDEQGMPVFSLDVRPAVDSPGAVYDRITEWARLKKESFMKSDDEGRRAAA